MCIICTLFLQMYDNISSLKFTSGGAGEPLASAMVSSEGEVMDFRSGVVAEGRVEDWMTAVLKEMRRTNRLITKESVFYYCDKKTRYCTTNRTPLYNRDTFKVSII